MVFFRGSSPPNFIQIYLDKQSTGNAEIPEPGSISDSTQDKIWSPPPFSPIIPTSHQANVPASSAVSFANKQEQFSGDQPLIDPSQIHVEANNSPFSVDSNVDVTSYAKEMVQRMEKTQS